MPINYAEYPPEFREVSARIRYDRAGNRCEWCGAENHKPHPVTGSRVVLTVAHLNHIKEDMREENLKALCQRCHLNHDRARHIHNRKYGRLTNTMNYNLFEEVHNE